MSFRDIRVTRWEDRLRAVFSEIDEYLETRYGHLYPLHPARPPKGATASPSQDGLFNIGAAFSAGFGSRHGPGYVVEIRISTLEGVPPDVQNMIEAEVVRLLKDKLPVAFPGRALDVKLDGHVFKIVGDLSFEDESG